MMRKFETKQEERLAYKATQEFVAYVSGDLTPAYIDAGTILIADPDHWTGWKWNGRESLRFFSERTQYYVDRKTFLNFTQSLN